jgi:hypothetical protein
MNSILKNDQTFQNLTLLHRQRLSTLITQIMKGKFRHDSLIPMAELDSSALQSAYLRKMFRMKKDGSYYKHILDSFFDCVNSTYQFGNGKGRTRKFKLKSWVIDDYLANLKDSKPIDFSRIKNNKHIPLKTIPENAVHEFDILMHPKSTKLKLNPVVEINADRIDQTIRELEQSNSVFMRNHVRLRNMIHLYQWKKLLNNTLVPNSIIQLYHESTNGRLSPKSELNFQNLINTPKRIRKILFSDMNLYDYDMSNSHFSIFYNLCERYDVECPNLKYYLENKKTLRTEWSDKYYLKTKVLKKYIISWLYGNKNNAIKENPLYNELGYVRMIEIKQDEILSGIYREIIKGRRVIVKRHRENGNIKNIMGKEREVKSLSKDLCFILFGYESKIMETVNKIIGDDMKVLIYDGWIGNKVDVNYLESVVKKELGLSIKFDEEPIESPSIFSLK